MKLSVIVPVYGVEETLRRCAESILGQSFRDLQLILVDDCSPDRCPQICDELAAKDMRVVVRHHKQNGGLSAARNTGLARAKGEYVTFVDSDDYLVDHAVDRMLEFIAAHPDTDTFIAPIRLRDEDTGREWTKDFASAPEGTLRGKDYLRRRPVSVCPVQFVFRKQLFSNPWVRFPEGVRHEDEYFCRVLQYFSGTVTVLDEPLSPSMVPRTHGV